MKIQSKPTWVHRNHNKKCEFSKKVVQWPFLGAQCEDLTIFLPLRFYVKSIFQVFPIMPSDYAKKKAQKKKEAAKQKGGKKPKETESGNF